MTISHNTFCWTGISTDLHAGKAFYPSVLGWTIEAEDTDNPVCVAKGGHVAHMQAPVGAPPNWCTYVAVDDLDQRTADAAAHGGSIVLPPTPLPAGRFSIVTTPSGAVFALYEAAPGDEMAESGPGSIHWVDLQSTDTDADIAWFKVVFGFGVRTQQMSQGPYHVLTVDGQGRGGITQSRSGFSAFTTWVEVADLDDTLAKVGTHGGKSMGPAFADPDVGRMAIVSDPSGAVFGLVQQPAA